VTVKGIECNVTIACAPYCRRLSMSTGKHGKPSKEGSVYVCVYMCALAEGIYCEGDWI